VELRAEDMGSERVLTTLQLPCGGPELPVSVAIQPAAPWPDDPAEQEVRMARLIDAERAQAGHPKLTWDPAVGKIARATAENYREVARKGAAAGSVNVVQRLREADIQAPLIEQNPAAAPNAEQAALRLLASPSHRARILSPEVTLGGLGVAAGANAAGQQLAYVSQIFVKVQQAPDVATSRATIREAIDRKRAAEKLGALATDPVLEKLAGDYAAVVAGAGGPPPKAKTDELVKTLQRGYRDVVFMVDSRIDLADFAEDPNALAKGKLVGLGGALGRHPRLGKNTLFVVLIIASKR
jgi:uncharacterized protein YkwD